MMRLQTQAWRSPWLVTASLALFSVAPPGRTAEPLARAQQMYPLIVAALQRQCAAPKTLSTQAFTTSTGTEIVGFICWSETTEAGYRTGQWLGRLPLSPVASFGEPLTCKEGDEQCDRWLPILQAQYPLALEQAEFYCAMRNGTLFTQFSEDAVTVRCGFFATTLYDENGDDRPDYEDPISADIPVTTLPLAE